MKYDNKQQLTITKQDKLFFAEIADILKNARETAYKSVNTIMVNSNWLVGKRIVEQEQEGKARANYGDFLIVNLSKFLSGTFGNGFSEANLWNFRQFYLTFPQGIEFSTRCVENSEGRQLTTQRVADSNLEKISWSHWRLIMRLDDEAERDFYIKETAAENWAVRTLERNIRSGYYRRLLSTQKKGLTSTAKKKTDTFEFVKDPYVLEFMDVPEDLTGKETVLENAIINNMQKFLLEMGKGFSFVSRQMRISTETSHFYLDLVFYNYILKCFVIIDLKTKKLTPQDIGQMELYVRMFDELKRGKDDNPTLGIILCTEKDETIVKYSVLSEYKQIFASKYKTILPTEKQLASMFEKSTRLIKVENKEQQK
jgi:predicted nuclease of restriction endonuclease-like (RecB) superfamily